MKKRSQKGELEKKICKIALLNAISHSGKARSDSIIGKLLANEPDLKAEVKLLIPIVKKVVNEVNDLTLSEQEKLVETKWPGSLAKSNVVHEKKLPPLPNVDKYSRVITRFSPNPDCVLHLGSARAIVLSHEYALEHEGLFYLRFEDTDPRLKRSALLFYESIRTDLEWLNCSPDAEFIQSDRIDIYYEHAEKLLERGKAYVCSCDVDMFRKLTEDREPCPCRNVTPEEQIAKWKKMLDGSYREGDAVVRVKTDLNHANPAVRDWPALRIINPEKHPHPRVGSRYRVWPLYNFACGVDDHLMGITHVIRGKEHLTNKIRQEYLFNHFGWVYPDTIHYGRLKIEGSPLAKSEIVRGVKTGVYSSWDDPRLATFAALRKRGINAEAIRRLMLDVGPKTADVVISWQNLYAYNRKIIDPLADRYFFVNNPKTLTVHNVPRVFNTNLPLHPENSKRGVRNYEITPSDGKTVFNVSGDDSALFKAGKTIRLMGLFNILVKKARKPVIEAVYRGESYKEAKDAGAPLIHWIPADKTVPCTVVTPDAAKVTGITEQYCLNLEEGSVIQFERFGFVKISKVNETVTAFYAHR